MTRPNCNHVPCPMAHPALLRTLAHGQVRAADGKNKGHPQPLLLSWKSWIPPDSPMGALEERWDMKDNVG